MRLAPERLTGRSWHRLGCGMCRHLRSARFSLLLCFPLIDRLSAVAFAQRVMSGGPQSRGRRGRIPFFAQLPLRLEPVSLGTAGAARILPKLMSAMRDFFVCG